MLRTFNEHLIRYEESYDCWWDFITAADRRDRTKLPKQYTRRIRVPAAWETLPDLQTYRGKAWYRTTVTARDAMALRILFGGVSHTATVYVDGRKVGEHYDAFTPWEVVVTGLAEGTHELVVEVDNAFGDHSALHKENDYYTYGGITRPVAVQCIPPLFIERMHTTPIRTRNGWDLEVGVRLRNTGRTAARGTVAFKIHSLFQELGTLSVKAASTREIRATIKGLSVDAWSPDTPVLYQTHALLLDGERAVDDLMDRVGFRDIAVKGTSILLNGEPIRLRGFNRHEDHPQFGNALPPEAMVTDLEIMSDLGANFVRTSHYPNDRRFLDLCDEIGFLVWEEHHARTVPFDHPRYKEQITTATEEMIDWHRNHPSIMMWGCLNECDSISAAGAREHTRILRLMKKLDPHRPVTFASNKGTREKALAEVDIVSWNLYPAWYSGGPENVTPTITNLLKWQHSAQSKGGKGKPVIISEFGAGGLYGWRTPQKVKWSEEYQADALDEYLRVFLNHPAISGTAIWQYCDVRITEGFWNGRPRTRNNKGVVDEYRRPKLAYEVVKKRMLEAGRAPAKRTSSRKRGAKKKRG
jgi:beta-glucuronidase